MLLRMRGLGSQRWQIWAPWLRSVGIGALAVAFVGVDSCSSFQQDEFRCDEAAARLQHCCAPLPPVGWPGVILNCSIHGCSDARALSWNEASSTCIRDSSCTALVQARACQVADWTDFDNACTSADAACSDDGGLDGRGVDGGAVACLARLQTLCQVRAQLSCQ